MEMCKELFFMSWYGPVHKLRHRYWDGKDGIGTSLLWNGPNKSNQTNFWSIVTDSVLSDGNTFHNLKPRGLHSLWFLLI